MNTFPTPKHLNLHLYRRPIPWPLFFIKKVILGNLFAISIYFSVDVAMKPRRKSLVEKKTDAFFSKRKTISPIKAEWDWVGSKLIQKMLLKLVVYFVAHIFVPRHCMVCKRQFHWSEHLTHISHIYYTERLFLLREILKHILFVWNNIKYF